MRRTTLSVLSWLLNLCLISALAIPFVLRLLPNPPTQAVGWNPPPGMVWKEADGCPLHSDTIANMVGCYYGPDGAEKFAGPGNGEEFVHTGVAFFRVCNSQRDPWPFLRADFDRRTYVFNPRPEGPEIKPENGNLGNGDSIDPEPFYDRIDVAEGFCGVKEEI